MIIKQRQYYAGTYSNIYKKGWDKTGYNITCKSKHLYINKILIQKGIV